MREELRRCNYFGSMESIFKFAQIAISDHPIDLKSITSICALDSNVERDKRNADELQKLGWKVLVVWECELKKKTIDTTLEQLEQRLCK